jgi:hypothetical protein
LHVQDLYFIIVQSRLEIFCTTILKETAKYFKFMAFKQKNTILIDCRSSP